MLDFSIILIFYIVLNVTQCKFLIEFFKYVHF